MRSRITITISHDLLREVDKTIDHNSVRNRSQAIETLLRKTVKPSVSTAVILAGGPSSLHPATYESHPKALIPIKNRPVIDHLLTLLKAHQFTHVIICTGSESNSPIKQFCGSGQRYDLKISYSTETKRLGTGGALKNASRLIGKHPFLLLHGDIITNINLSEFINFFVQQKKLASVAVKPRPGKLSYGRIYLEGSEVIKFHEPTSASPISLINTGIYIFDPSIFKLMPTQSSFKLEDKLIPVLVKKNQLSGYVFQGIWFDISDSDDFTEANNRWPED